MKIKGSVYNDFKKRYYKFLKNQETKNNLIKDKTGKFNNFYLPLSNWIYKQYSKDKKIKIIGLSGGQGTGKSTVTGILEFILKNIYGLNTCIFSIDDFYKTKSQRKKMSKKIHPLFSTRGVPGTHDVSLINKKIRELKKKRFKQVLLPRFDKSTDDRHKKDKWAKIKKSPQIIIFEGWCVGAKHQKYSLLKKPLNSIERKHDAELKWRKKVNYYLKNNYKNLFNKIDKLIYLKAPSYDYVFKWRSLQEKKLKLTSKNKNTMSKSQIREFIMFYERITRQMMIDFKYISDLTVFLDKDHRSKKIKFF